METCCPSLSSLCQCVQLIVFCFFYVAKLLSQTGFNLGLYDDVTLMHSRLETRWIKKKAEHEWCPNLLVCVHFSGKTMHKAWSSSVIIIFNYSHHTCNILFWLKKYLQQLKRIISQLALIRPCQTHRSSCNYAGCHVQFRGIHAHNDWDGLTWRYTKAADVGIYYRRRVAVYTSNSAAAWQLATNWRIDSQTFWCN